MRKSLINLLGYEGHIGMKELKNVRENVDESTLCGKSLGSARLEGTALRHLDIPVAEEVPCEGIYLTERNSYLVVFNVIGYALYKLIKSRKNPLILDSKLVRRGSLQKLLVAFGEIHKNESRCVPELVCEVSCRLDLLVGEAHIVTGSVTRCKRKAESIGAELLDNLKRINTVAERLRHLSSLRISYETVNEDLGEGLLTYVLKSREYHSRHPEGDYIVTRN